MTDLTKAIALLAQSGDTCVLCRENQVIRDARRGIRPLLELLDSGIDLSGFSAADKVVGKAAAHVYCLLNIRCLHAGVLSLPAKSLLERGGIPVTYDTLVPAIQNRAQTGLCPMESAVWHISDHNEAVQAVRTALSPL